MNTQIGVAEAVTDATKAIKAAEAAFTDAVEAARAT